MGSGYAADYPGCPRWAFRREISLLVSDKSRKAQKFGPPSGRLKDITNMTEIGLFDAMYTARALRRLKPDPVPDELITRVLDVAIRAPSGGNAQNWIFLVVRDEAQRRRLGAVYRKASDEVAEIYAARGRPAHLSDEQYRRLMAGREYLGSTSLKHPFCSCPA